MYRPKNTQERILHRMKIAKGQLEKVIKMTEEQDYCINIIHQSQAIQKALEEIDILIMENHLNTCVVDKIKGGEANEAIKEVMSVLKKQK